MFLSVPVNNFQFFGFSVFSPSVDFLEFWLLQTIVMPPYTGNRMRRVVPTLAIPSRGPENNSPSSSSVNGNSVTCQGHSSSPESVASSTQNGGHMKRRSRRIRRNRGARWRWWIVPTLLSFLFLRYKMTVNLHHRHNHQQQQRKAQLHPSQMQFQLYSESAPLCAQLHAEEVDFTLVIQMSSDRLWMMEHHCQRWGPNNKISLAVLSNETWQETIKVLVDDLHCDSTQLTLTILDAQLYPDSDYPVNILRNLAVNKVKTSHLVYVDVDFWASQDVYEVLQKPHIRQALAENSKLALVLPAFQLYRQCKGYVDCRDDNLPYMPKTRSDLIDMIMAKRGLVFDPTNKGGQGTTLYREWVNQKPESLLEIPCFKSNRYEPFLVVRYCRELPPYQEKFNGYGKNKMTWVMQLRRSGYIFHQVGGIFLVHYPHLESKARISWNEAPQELIQFRGKNGRPYLRPPTKEDTGIDFLRFKRGQVDKTFVEFRTWLTTNVQDQSKVPMCEVTEDDDSRLWIDRSSPTTSPDMTKVDASEERQPLQ